MYYRGQVRRRLQEVRRMVGELLARDERIEARPRGDRAALPLFAGDDLLRLASERLLAMCQAALLL